MKTECKILLMIPLMIGVFSLTGCSNGGSSTADTRAEVVPAGIWLGYQEVHDAFDSQVFDMKTIIYDGSFYGISEGADIMYSGTYAMKNGRFLTADGANGTETSYKMYSIYEEGRPFARGITTLTISERDAMQGVFENDALQEGEITAYFSALSDKKPSLNNLTATVEQDRMAFTVDGSGTINGIKDGCTINGSFTVPQPEINIYAVSYALSGADCEKSGNYAGLGIIALDENTDAYFLALSRNSDESRMDRIFYSLGKTPAEFTAQNPEPASLDENESGEENTNPSPEEILATVEGVNLSGAWWTDGSRCGSISIGGCAERTYESGLSYEEVVARKKELQIESEAFSSRTRQSAQEGVSFVGGGMAEEE